MAILEFGGAASLRRWVTFEEGPRTAERVFQAAAWRGRLQTEGMTGSKDLWEEQGVCWGGSGSDCNSLMVGYVELKTHLCPSGGVE